MDRDDLDRLEWNHLRELVERADREVAPRAKRPEYSDVLIVLMYHWAVSHDRTMKWACRRSSYHGLFRPRKLPTESTFCRRRRSLRCLAILQRVHELAARVEECSEVNQLDGKPLVVGPCSKDRDAKRGAICGGFAVGYKLHALGTQDGRIPVWSVQPLNVDERPVASEMIRHVPVLELVLADGNYDAGYLYKEVGQRGGSFFTPHRKKPYTVKRCRKNCAARLEALHAWEPWGIGGYVYEDRLQIERTFANSTSYAGGLGPLPAWVRTWPRVTQWVGAKFNLYHVRLDVRHRIRAGMCN